MPLHSAIDQFARRIMVAEDRFAPGHLGELTRIVPFGMVDAVLAETNTVQRRVRDLPSRVVVYVLLAAALFVDCGYRQVWARLVAGLEGLSPATASAAALAAAGSARHRCGSCSTCWPGQARARPRRERGGAAGWSPRSTGP